MEIEVLVLLCVAAFAAGFVDAVVGGGGLIQLPVALVLLPAWPVASVVGSLKVPAFTGTAVAALQYARRVTMNWRLLAVVCTLAFFASYGGSWLLTQVSNAFMKPVLLLVLAAIAVYTFAKKDFGQKEQADLPSPTQLLRAVVISLVIGFYDGFIGPGTGSLLVLLFIAALHFDFLHASAHAKLVNLATNLGSVTLFVLQGKIVWAIALPMAVANAAGGFVGARLAIAKGNRFIRVFFLVVVIGILVRLGWDVFGNK